jgi:hypothetical protein
MTVEISVVPTEVPVAEKKLFETTKFLASFVTMIPVVNVDASALLPYKSKERNEIKQGRPAIIVLDKTLTLKLLELGDAGTTLKIETFLVRG